MAKDPAFLFYAKDFYEGTRTMLPEERACFIDLLIYQHQNGFIPEDIRRIKMYCTGVSEATLIATLEAKFKRCDKGWVNHKLKDVNEDRAEFSKKQSANGFVGQFFKKAKKQLKNADYEKLRYFLKDKYTTIELAKLIEGYDNFEAGLQAMLQAMLKHLANADAIGNENKNEKGGVGEKTNGHEDRTDIPTPNQHAKADVVYPFGSLKFRKAWDVWRDHLLEVGKQYRGFHSEQMELKHLSHYARGDELKAIAVIEWAIRKQFKSLNIDLYTQNGEVSKAHMKINGKKKEFTKNR